MGLKKLLVTIFCIIFAIITVNTVAYATTGIFYDNVGYIDVYVVGPESAYDSVEVNLYNDNGEKYSFIATTENNYKIIERLPIGNYVVDVFVNGLDSSYVFSFSADAIIEEGLVTVCEVIIQKSDDEMIDIEGLQATVDPTQDP
ncbi:MAG: hypothetical protein PHD60_10555, partial [Clostridia bacterium]|nr:hypothetical protein [Clostridia bacterium]